MSTELPVSRTGATDREVEAVARAIAASDNVKIDSYIAEQLALPEDYRMNAEAAIAALDAARAAAAPDSGQRERLARWLFERDYRDRVLCSPSDAPWDGWVERNQDQWREEADAILALLAEQPGGGK